MEHKPPITRSQLSLMALVCLSVLIAANLVVHRLTSHTVSRRVIQDARNSSGASAFALGNSLIRAGFVPKIFAPPEPSLSSKPNVVNLALGASSPVEQLLILREAFRSNPNPRLLIYGFYDFQLTDPVSFSNADLIGNHDILYYQEPEFARRFFYMSPYDSAAFEIARHLPMLAERGAVWAKVELLRRFLAQQGMPSESRNQFGRVADFTLLEAGSRAEFERHCRQASAAGLNAPVSEIVLEARQHQAQLAVVLMPLPPRHVENFYATPAWSAYQLHLRQLLAAQNVQFVDASRWIPEAGQFGDALHLTDQGAAEFSRRLGMSLRPAMLSTP